MTQVLITESYLDDIADAIRDKNGSEDLYTPAQMASAIEALPEPVEPDLISKAINTNGTYSAEDEGHDGYSQVAVQVPNSYAAGDEGKVVSSGALVSQTSTTKSANGTYDTTLNNEVVVDVPNTYTASDEGKVVDSGALVTQGSLEITQNGTFDTTLISEVVANVEDEELRQMVYNVYPTELANGGLVTITDGAGDIPVKDMVVKVNPVQAGTGDPSPQNIRSISGWTGASVTVTGKNLCPHVLQSEASNKGYTATPQSDGTLIITGTWTGTGNNVIGGSQSARFLLKAGQYILNGNESSAYSEYGLRLQLIDADNNTYGFDNGNGFAFTLDTDTIVSVRIYVTHSIATGKTIPDGGVILRPMIRLATDDDPTFEPYTGNTYDITFPSEAGTVYGGTVDVTNGTLKVTKANIASYAGETLPGAWISDRDVYAEGTTPTTGAQVVYDLATPLTFTIDPVTIRTLLGLNNIWANCGPIEKIEYRADIKLYIENLTKPTEDDLIANQAIEAGKFFMINNRLFLSTASIANGAAITPGTNATELSLSEALNTLNA